MIAIERKDMKFSSKAEKIKYLRLFVAKMKKELKTSPSLYWDQELEKVKKSILKLKEEKGKGEKIVWGLIPTNKYIKAPMKVRKNWSVTYFKGIN